MFFLHIKSSPNLLFGVLCLPGDQSHSFAQPTINPLACCICWAGLLGRAVFPPWNEGPNFGSYKIIKYFQLHDIGHILASSSPLIACDAENYRYFPKMQVIKIKTYSHFHILSLFKRREAKSKGAKERYSHLNAEFQRIARRHKKAFLSNQCKEIEENNRMGKTRDLLRKLEISRDDFMQRWVR